MEILNTFNVLLVTGAVLLYAWIKYRLSYWQRRGVEISDIGALKNSIRIMLAQNSFADRGLQYYRYFKSKGVKYGGSYAMFSPVFVPVDLDIIKSIMQGDFQHFVDRGVYMNEEGDPLSAHLFNLTGNKWKILRHKLTPTFTSGKMKMMFETLVNCTNGLHKVMNDTKGEELDIKEILGRCFFRINKCSA